MNSNELTRTVNTRIRTLRLASGIPQGRIAELIGKSQSWLSYVESGSLVPDGAETRAIFNAISVATKDRDRKFKELLASGIASNNS